MQIKAISDELLKAFDEYLNALSNRNFQGTIACFSERISGFGSGLDEYAHNLTEAKDMYKREFDQAPDPIKFVPHWKKTNAFNTDAGVVYALCDIHLELEGHPFIFENVRLSTVFSKKNKLWKLEHLHLSMPTGRQDEGESVPLQELEKRNSFLEKTVEERTNILRQQQIELEKHIETKNRLFSIIAHDLKSPFNSLIGLSELLIIGIDEISKKETLKQISYINDSSRSLYRVVENMLDWARSESGQIELHPQSFPLKKLIYENIELYQADISKKNITLNLSNNIECIVFGDYAIIGILFRNILYNAIKFSFPDGVILLNAFKKNKETHITVQDFGIGMDQEQIESVKNGNSLESQPGTMHEKGTGLGLTSCMRLIKVHQGKLLINSEKGKGTLIEIVFPETV